MELFPTPWSPKNTILSLVQFLVVLEDAILILYINVIYKLKVNIQNSINLKNLEVLC